VKLLIAGWLGMLLVGAGLAMAADHPAVGTWQVTSKTDSGEEYTWKMIIKNEDGKLTGVLSGEMGDFQLADLKYENDTLSFKVQIEDQSYATEAKIAGNKLDGTFKGTGASGTLTGTRQS
jgi:hypothetical protein